MASMYGLEPQLKILEIFVLPLHYTEIKMVLPPRIKLGIHDYKSSVISFNYRSKPGSGCKNLARNCFWLPSVGTIHGPSD